MVAYGAIAITTIGAWQHRKTIKLTMVLFPLKGIEHLSKQVIYIE